MAWNIPENIVYDSGRTNLKYHARAMSDSFLRKGATGYTQQCEIWHGTSLRTLIKIQEVPFLRTIEDYVLAIKGHTLAITRKGGHRINLAM